MRVLTIVHQADAGAGVFGVQAEADGHELVEWVPADGAAPPLDGVEAAMAFGGAMHVDQEDVHPWLRADKELIRELIARRTPLLGVCLGSQLIAEAAGAAPRRASRPEIGWHRIDLTDEGAADPLLGELPRSFEGFGWHSYEWPLPEGAVALANSDVCLQAFRLGDAPAWGVQFHPEVARDSLWHWLDHYDADEDAVRIGLDAEALRAESEGRIGEWNAVGRGIASRFLREAEAAIQE
jgi:GMP synthase-like glutamine amidotransferase